MTNEQPACGTDTGLRNAKYTQTPHDKLMMAIGILQAHYLASDTDLVPDRIFGEFYFSTTGMEHAINMLIELLPEMEKVPS